MNNKHGVYSEPGAVGESWGANEDKQHNGAKLNGAGEQRKRVGNDPCNTFTPVNSWYIPGKTASRMGATARPWSSPPAPASSSAATRSQALY